VVIRPAHSGSLVAVYILQNGIFLSPLVVSPAPSYAGRFWSALHKSGAKSVPKDTLRLLRLSPVPLYCAPPAGKAW
jgi:hypothetical protein